MAASLALGLGLGAPTAKASLFDTYGFGARATAMGGAMVASSFTYESIYYNPANMLTHKITHLGLGVTLIVPDLFVDRLAGEQEFEPLLPATNLGFHVGVTAPVRGVFDKKLAFGVCLFNPLVKFTRVESIDASFPHFYRYQSLPDKLILAGAAAYEPVEWLRIGVGAQLLAELGGEVTASISLTERRFTDEKIDIELDGVISPTAGLAVGPFEGLRFGVTYRHRLELRYELPISVVLEDVGVLGFNVDGSSLYTPSQLAFGVSWSSDPDKLHGWTVEAAATWEMWRDAPPAGALFELYLDDSILREEEAEDGRPVQNLIQAVEPLVPLEARDILVPRLGVEWRPTPEWAVRAGYFFRPTPLPRPIYQTNTLDSTAHVISLGGGFTFTDPTKVLRAPLIIDLAIQLTRLSDRLVNKAPGGQPDGAYGFGGLIWNISSGIRHHF